MVVDSKFSFYSTNIVVTKALHCTKIDNSLRQICNEWHSTSSSWPLRWRDVEMKSYCEVRASWVICDKSLNASSLWSFLLNSIPWNMTLDDRYWLPKAVPKPHPRPTPIPQPPPLKQNFKVMGGFYIKMIHSATWYNYDRSTKYFAFNQESASCIPAPRPKMFRGMPVA